MSVDGFCRCMSASRGRYGRGIGLTGEKKHKGVAKVSAAIEIERSSLDTSVISFLLLLLLPFVTPITFGLLFIRACHVSGV